MFKFYLDTTEVSDPLNWKDFSETIERDDVLKALLPKYENKLQFTGGGYDYLYSKYKSDGFCNLVQINVDYSCDGGVYENVMEGYIFITDCKFNLNKCVVDCDVTDNNYGARIYNNKNVKAKIDVGYSKNGEAITPATITTAMGFFDVNNSLLFYRDVFHIKDVFRFLIDFMTDGLVGFESDFLEQGNVDKTAGWLYISLGSSLRDIFLAPTISFEELFTELNKKYPIAFTIINVAGKPTIKLENESYFYNAKTSLTLSNINDLQLSFNNELLYSRIILGDPAADFDPLLGDFPIIRFLSFTKEEYQLQGECNIDKALDLVGSWVADSNIIQRIIQSDTSNTQYDEEIIWIESILGVAINLTNSPTTNTQPYYYNANLTNNNVAERYYLQGNIAFYLGNNNQAFSASMTALYNMLPYVSLTTPDIIFDDDFTPPNFDTVGAYDPINGQYTSIADGVYSFEASFEFVITSVLSLAIGCEFITNWIFGAYVVFNLYDSFGFLVQSYEDNPYLLNPFLPSNPNEVASNGGTNTLKIKGNKSINVIAGYYVTVTIRSTVSDACAIVLSWDIVSGAYFKTTAIQNGGGVYKQSNIPSYFAAKLEFNKPISHEDYKSLKVDLSKNVKANTDGANNKTGWLRKTTRIIETGETKWELISNITNT